MSGNTDRLVAALILATHLAFAGWAGDRRMGAPTIVHSSVGIVDLANAMVGGGR